MRSPRTDVARERKVSGQLTKDKRNMHLADVGRIDNNSGDLWTQLSSGDKSKRLNAIRTKADKLKNPNFMVSAVRLSVRNLPRHADEYTLRHMFASGKKSVLRQVKLVKVRRMCACVCALSASHRPCLQDEDNQSKGFGFVEFKEHDEALKALHRVNNNASFFGAEQRPIVEFAVDDARKVELRKRSQQMDKAPKARGLVRLSSRHLILVSTEGPMGEKGRCRWCCCCSCSRRCGPRTRSPAAQQAREG